MFTSASEKTTLTDRAYYSDLIEDFLARCPDEVLGVLTKAQAFSIEAAQRDAWIEQIRILSLVLAPYRGLGKVYFEFAVPRVGKRIDVVALIRHVVLVIEFKVGETDFTASSINQVWDYALDLKNFHETSHDKNIAPILVATRATHAHPVAPLCDNDGLLRPMPAPVAQLSELFGQILAFCGGPPIDATEWETGRYRPTPNIVEAAMALYGGHAVEEISRSDAGAINLSKTSEKISKIISSSKAQSRKSICFVTGVPGAGKTLVGLNIATKHIDRDSALYSVFLSGNGPLVSVLREALARDKVRREAVAGRKFRKGVALSEVKLFVQNVHHFRDDCLVDVGRPPIEHVALFDEAQRAWNFEQTSSFMRQKKHYPDFRQSEPEFLMSCFDRHKDWAVVVCLVGGGQEINTGEAGISEWVDSILRSFPEWHVYVSPRVKDSEYAAGNVLRALSSRKHVHHDEELHLGVSMRSFRAENVSALAKQLLDLNHSEARRLVCEISDRYPIAITRDLSAAKSWLRTRARGSERFGLVVSSQAQRLKPHAIDVRSPIDPVHWFLDDKEDVRSSYFLEDAATEFHVQGLELDWSCVVWDADFRYSDDGWQHFSFVGDRWHQIRKPARREYQKNAYRVLLTRARQGMVIVVPDGDDVDATRKRSYYDPTFQYLTRTGFNVI